MSYSGEVSPGGPADVRELGGLRVSKVAVDPEMSNNAYLLRCTATGEQLLVDAAAEPQVLLDLVGDGGLATVVTTHQHWDHHRALADVVAATGAATVAGADDAAAITDQTGCAVDRSVGDGDTVSVGEVTLDVIHLVGHTPGSIALVYRDRDETDGTSHHLWTGDSLFPGGVGNTGGDAEAFASLLDDVEAKVFDRLPDDTWFYPGHGSDSTLGQQRPQVPEWRARGW